MTWGTIGQRWLGIAAVALALAGCSPGESEQQKATEPQQPQAQSGNTAAATRAAYPLDTCVVSGQKLGSMGDPLVVKIDGRDVQLCCSHCEEDLRKEPQKYLAKLDAATKASTTKPVSAG